MSGYVEAANALETLIAAEFADDGVTIKHDQIHPAAGYKLAPLVGIAPGVDGEVLSRTNALVQETYIEVRWIGKWDKMVDPLQYVDPRPIAQTADRLRGAIRDAAQSASQGMWFFTVVSTTYPDDPTGNKTRFHMLIKAVGSNSALVETVS